MIASSNLSKKQQTIKNQFSLKGIGLHSGEIVNLVIQACKTDNGIKFVRTDLSKDNINRCFMVKCFIYKSLHNNIK